MNRSGCSRTTAQSTPPPASPVAGGRRCGSFHQGGHSTGAHHPRETCFIGGGGETHAAAWPYLAELDITHVHQEPEGAVTFPAVAPHEWTETSRETHEGYDFVRFRRFGHNTP